MATKTGSSYTTGTTTDSVEIPTASRGFSTMASSNIVSPSDYNTRRLRGGRIFIYHVGANTAGNASVGRGLMGITGMPRREARGDRPTPNKKYRGESILLFQYKNLPSKNLKIETAFLVAIHIWIQIRGSWIQVRIFHLSLYCRRHSQIM